MVTEMLLNSDIRKKKKFQMISHFHKKINLIMYIIEKKFKLNFNYFIWSNFQKKCGDLMIRVFASILNVKKSNFTNGVFVVNNDKLIEYFPM